MRINWRNILLAGALVGAVACASVGAAEIIRLPGVGAAEEQRAEIDSGTFTRKVNSTGGLLYMPFDGIGVYTKTNAGAAALSLQAAIPSTAKAIALEVKNNVPTNLSMTVSLKAGQTAYTLSGEYYTADRATGTLTAATSAEGVVTLAQPRASFEAFNGYAVLDLSGYSVADGATVDGVEIGVPLSTAATFAVGSIWAFDAVPTGTLDVSAAQKVFTPAEGNFTAGGDTDNYVAKFYGENSFVKERGVTTDTFDPTFFRFPTQVKDTDSMLTDVSAYKAVAIKVDFSQTETGFTWMPFFFNNKTTYNATRMWPTSVFGIGDTGEYFGYTYSAVPNGAAMAVVPAGFKGTVYADFSTMFNSSGQTVEDAAENLYAYFAVYNYDASRQLQVNGAIKEMWLTDTLPATEHCSVNVTVNNEERGTVTLDPAKTVIKGSYVTVTPHPNTGYVVSGLKVDGSAVTLTEGAYTIAAVNADTQVEVEFGYDPNSDRFAWSSTGDHVTVTADKTEVPMGTDVTFTFTPEFSYRVSEVKINGEAVELDGNTCTVKEVTGDLNVVVTAVPVEQYVTQLGESSGTAYRTTREPGAVYAEFDSVLVSSKLSAQADSNTIASTPYVGLDLGGVSVNDWTKSDVLVIRYRHYHITAGNKNGVKFLLEDGDGEMARDTSGANVYLSYKNTQIENGDILTTSAEANIGGGMVFTPANFSGYLVLPVSCFTSPTAEDGDMAASGKVNFSNIVNVIAFTEYKWSTDVSATYAIGDMYLAKLDKDTLEVSDLTQIWSPEEAEVTPWLRGVYPEGVTANDFMFTAKMKAGNVYLFDYSQYYKNTASQLKIKFAEEMLTNGEASTADIKGLRLFVDNSASDQAIEYSLSLFAAGTDAEWKLSGMGKAVFHNAATGKNAYCTSNTTVIPAGFQGEIYLPLNNSLFTSVNGDTQFPAALSDSFCIGFPVVSSSQLGHGFSFGFDCDVLTNHSDAVYEVEDTSTQYTVTYVLDGGTNAQNNPATYTVADTVTLAAASKEGYRFDGWYLTPDFSGAAVTKLETTCGNLTLYAKWGASHTVTWEVNEGGTVYPTLETVEHGQTVVFALFPDDGYEIVYVAVNGTPVELSEEDTFTVVAEEDLSIKVTFGKTAPSEPEQPEEPKGGCGTIGFMAGGMGGGIALGIIALAAGLVIGLRKKKLHN